MITYTPSWHNDFDFECEYIPSWYNDFDFPYLGCDNILGDVEMFDGDAAAADITIGVEWVGYDGSHLEFDLIETEIPWEFVAFDGADVDFKISPTAQFRFPLWHGEALSGDLSTYGFVYMHANADHGENIEFNLSRNQVLSFNVYDGEEVNSDILYSIAEGMVANAAQGENVEFDLSFSQISIRSYIKHGEQVIIDGFSTLKPLELPIINASCGEELSRVVFAPSYRLTGDTYHDVGSCVADLINTQDGLWRVRTGEQSSIELSIDYGMHSNGYAGENVEVDLLTREPIGIEANAYDGHGWYIDLRHLYSAPLYPYPIINDSWMDVAIDPAWLHFSTCKSCKLPIVHDDIIIRLERFEDVRTTWSAEIETSTTFELTRDIRPETNSYGGEELKFHMDTVEVIEIAMGYDGSSIVPLYLTTEEKIITDRTNPILDGTEIITDNGSFEPIPEEFVYTRAGEQCFTQLSAQRNPEAALVTGDILTWDLTVESWEMSIRHGEEIAFSLFATVQLAFDAYDGSSTEQVIYHGEHVEFNIKLTYDVEWQETGCLDNEWTYEDKSENTPVAIEQTPFRHSLKARCY